jgi:integrase/recombinase XerC/integrase/recombinase XerD
LTWPTATPASSAKGGAADVIVWQSGTGRLLTRLIKVRTAGPLFLTDRRARVPLAAAGLDPPTSRPRPSYRQAAALFTSAPAGMSPRAQRGCSMT